MIKLPSKIQNQKYYMTEPEKFQPRMSGLKFKPVGGRLVSRTTRRSMLHDLDIAKKEAMIDEVSPEKEEEDLKDISSIYKYTVMEDTRVSRFTHHQLMLVQKNILVLALLIIFLGTVKVEADTLYTQRSIPKNIMFVISCTTVMLLFLVVWRRVLFQQLQLDQRQIYARKDERSSCKSSVMRLFREKDAMLGLAFQFLAILPHPFYLLDGVTYTFQDQNLGVELVYSVNDFLNCLMLVKIYLVFRSIICMTTYVSPRTVRLCRYNNVQHSYQYILKCIQQEYPLTFTTVISLVFMVLFSFGFRVTEGNLYYNNPIIIGNKTGFQSFDTCLWFTFITMTSIGYGQYSPMSDMGKFLAGFIAIFGVILNSLLVVALTEYLKMKTGQIRSHTTLLRLDAQKKLFGQSATILAQTIKATKMITEDKFDPMVLKRLKPVFQNLKTKIDKSKAYTKRIKNILPQENKTELMIHQFELVKDNFKSMFNQQRKIKQKIGKIESLKGGKLFEEVHKSFVREVYENVKKYQQ